VIGQIGLLKTKFGCKNLGRQFQHNREPNAKHKVWGWSPAEALIRRTAWNVMYGQSRVLWIVPRESLDYHLYPQTLQFAQIV